MVAWLNVFLDFSYAYEGRRLLGVSKAGVRPVGPVLGTERYKDAS